jgi:DNA mismatch repair protein MutS2
MPLTGAGPLAVGQRVRVGGASAGEVLELRGDGKVAVRVGAMRMVVDAATVVPVGGESPAPPEPARPAAASDVDAASEIDLRGMTGDEAEAATLSAVDAAVLGDLPYLRIIHGMGTGVVRERVQRVLRGDRRVAGFAFAPRNQGGTGVTIAEFRQ